MNKEIEVLDCTLRDGGYHNNWKFNVSLINDYLNCMSLLDIKYVELGFRFLNKDKLRGETAFTSEKFIKRLSIPKNLSIGVMINAGDFFKNNLILSKICNETFPNLKKSKIKFVRIACHHQEIFKIGPIINWLKKRDVLVAVNLMQISELKNKEILSVSKFLSKKNFDILYFADSLGCLKPKNVETIKKLLGRYWKGAIGIHAHDNLNLALENTLKGKNSGIQWLDSTVSGMGRGPGNTRTEELIKHIGKNDKSKKSKIKSVKTLIKTHFHSLKKKYNWGTNKYYKFAAKNKIHPTYIQEILTDKRYPKKSYSNILNNLKLTDSRKFNPFKLISPTNIYSGRAKGNWNPFSDIAGRDILIIGAGKTANSHSIKIEKFVKKNKLFVISLNTNKNIKESFINLRTACHPFRILSDIGIYENRTKLAIPFSMLPKTITEKIKIKKKNIKDFGISVDLNKSIKIKKNYCIIPNSLAISYSFAIAIAGKAQKIYLAGFDGFNIDDTKNDETQLIFNLIKKRFKKLGLYSITPTKYNLKIYK